MIANKLSKALSGWLACAFLVSACGGGGGSPGSNSNGVAPSKAASVVLLASADTIASSGVDGTEVTLTAVVKDANNNALANETVDFKADSGSISNTRRITDANGMVVEKLSVKGNATPRVISITASAGSASSAAVKVSVVTAVPTLTLTTDAGMLASSGAPGSEVTLVALVKDGNNTVMPGVKVELAVDSGSLSLGNRVTDAKGIVSEKLSTGNDPTSRAIKITASVPGAAPATTIVNVVGTKLSVNASSTVNVGASTDITIKLSDSAGNALNGRPVAFSSGANGLSVKGGGAAVTNTAGQLILTYTAGNSGGSDTISVRAMGETASAPLTINASNFWVRPVDGGGNVVALANINSCQKVLLHADSNGLAQGGNVTLSSSRGDAYRDPGCQSLLSQPLVFDAGGNATGYVSASGPGLATLTATANGTTVQNTLEFVAPLTSSATILIQVDPAVVGVNLAGSTSQQATLRAVVRDGTAQNNLVKNAQVAFSIVTDASGGTLTQPSIVTTASDGSATVSYIAGSSPTALDGVLVQARLMGASTASATARLTVAQRSLFITAGTGNTVLTPNSATYQVDYSVFVSDAAGNAVPGVKVTGSILPRYYYKGAMSFEGTDGPWKPLTRVQCANEDSDGSGMYTSAKDINGNGRLDPGIPISVTPAVVTDAKGQATVSLLYPRDRANWLDVDLTIRGQVSGTEARYVGFVSLVGLSTDYSTKNISPPGVVSPYGTASSCTVAN